MGYSAVAYPWTLVAAKLKSIRETLDELKRRMTLGAPPMILGYSEVCEGVGFNRYWVSASDRAWCILANCVQDRETRYEYNEDGLVNLHRN